MKKILFVISFMLLACGLYAQGIEKIVTVNDRNSKFNRQVEVGNYVSQKDSSILYIATGIIGRNHTIQTALNASLLEKITQSQSSTRISLALIAIDTTMLGDSTFGRILSDGWIIDTLLFTIYSDDVASAKFHLYYGPNWTSTGTEVITGGTTVTAEGVATKVYTFNNATIPVNNFIWGKFTGTITAEYFSCQIKGHRK